MKIYGKPEPQHGMTSTTGKSTLGDPPFLSVLQPRHFVMPDGRWQMPACSLILRRVFSFMHAHPWLPAITPASPGSTANHGYKLASKSRPQTSHCFGCLNLFRIPFPSFHCLPRKPVFVNQKAKVKNGIDKSILPFPPSSASLKELRASYSNDCSSLVWFSREKQ